MTPQTTTTYCSRCGKALDAGSRYCAGCGTAAGGTVNATAANTTPIPVVPRPGAAPRQAQPEDQVVADLREATIGEFDVYAELGRGGMAVVYLALDLTLNRPVAIKVMSPALLYGEGMTERFKREARTAASLSHPNIIPIFAVKETPKILFFVMKYVEGRALDSIVKELGSLPLPMVHTVLTQVGGALAYAHRRGVVHRDIKPANIMIDEEGWCIVTDFGIAKVQEAKSLTSTGAMVGTPHYMSPEQYSGTALSGASDQYALGIVAYELLGGKPPFNGDSIAEVMKGHLFDPPRPLNEVRTDCPPALVEIVMRMLAKKPADRFPALDDAVKALAALHIKEDHHVREQLVELAKTGLQHRPRISVPQSPIPLGRRTPTVAATPRVGPAVTAKSGGKKTGLLAGGLAATLLVAAAGGWFVMQGRGGGASAANPLAAAPTVTLPTQNREPTVLANNAVAAPVESSTPAAPDPSAVTKKPDAPAPRQADPAAERQRLAKVRADSIRVASASAAAARKESDRLAREKADREERDRLAREAQAANAAAKEPERPAVVAAPAALAALSAAPGKIRIGSRADNVTIFIDGKSLGALKSLREIDVPAGKHDITLSTPGCAPFDLSIDVASGATSTVGYRSPKCQ